MRIRIPRPKLDKRKKLTLMLVSVILIGVTSSYLFSTETTRSIFDYGTVQYQAVSLGVTTVLNAGDTLFADISDVRVIFTWTSTVIGPDASDFHGVLRTSIFDTIEDVYATRTGNIYSFTFDLKKCHEGTFDYYISLYCTTGLHDDFFYSGKSIVFTVVNTIQTVEAPKWIELPEDIPELVIGYPQPLQWKYQYNAPATLTLEMDGTAIDTVNIEGSPYTNQYSYTYDPQEAGSHRFRLTLDPDDILHLPIWDEMDVGVVTWEDYILIEGIPEVLDGLGIQIDSKLAYIGLDIQHIWTEETDFVPSDVYAFPKTSEMRIRLVAKISAAWTTFETTPIGEIRLIMTGADGESNTYDFVDVYALDFSWMGITIDSWKETTVDLDALADGEYDCSIRWTIGPYIYEITTFKISVDTFPTSWIIVNTGILLLGGVIFVLAIKGLREMKGWWEFKGRYGK